MIMPHTQPIAKAIGSDSHGFQPTLVTSSAE